jgi:hypothetical protein
LISLAKTRHVFNISNLLTNKIETGLGYGETEEEARLDAEVRYIDYQMGDVTSDQVVVLACISKGEGAAIIECEGCSA